jgi:DNA topoisomerase-1
LKRCIDTIRQDYIKKVEGEDLKNKQLGTATYLIDKLALRVGN